MPPWADIPTPSQLGKNPPGRRLGKDLGTYRPFWLDDATRADDREAFRLIRQPATTPLALASYPLDAAPPIGIASDDTRIDRTRRP